jgi:hypothetical protein
MPDLRDLLEGAVDRPAPLDIDQLGHRVARRQRNRRIARLAAAVTVVAVGGVALALARSAGDGDNVRTVPPAGEGSGGTDPEAITTTTEPGGATETTTAPGGATETTTAPSPGTGAPASASVSGDPGGAPPCAEQGASQEGASVEHPERAPLQAEATFADGVRWAVCGADPVFSSELLNLRSEDGGQSWSVTTTGLSMSPSHAGDQVDVQLTTATTGQIRLASDVGERDDRYETDDGGLTWQPVQ